MFRLYVNTGSGISEARIPVSAATMTFGELPAIQYDISNNVTISGTTDIYGNVTNIYGTVTLTDENGTVVVSKDANGDMTFSGTNTSRTSALQSSITAEPVSQESATSIPTTSYSIKCMTTGATYALTDAIIPSLITGGRTIVCKKT